MKSCLAGFLLAVSAMSYASTPGEKAERFLQQVTSPQSDQAVDQLFAGSEFAKQKPQVVDEVKNKILLSMRLAGKPIDIEKVSENDLTPSLKRLMYVQKFEEQPTLWTFYFYKAHDDWMIISINYADNIPAIPDLKW